MPVVQFHGLHRSQNENIASGYIPKATSTSTSISTDNGSSSASTASSCDSIIEPVNLSSRGRPVYSLMISDLDPKTTEQDLLHHIAGNTKSALFVRICRNTSSKFIPEPSPQRLLDDGDNVSIYCDPFYVDSCAVAAKQQQQSIVAYINFDSKYERDWALASRNGYKLHGSSIRITRVSDDPQVGTNCLSGPNQQPYAAVFVSQLSPLVDSRTLFDEFYSFGPIVSCSCNSQLHIGSIRFAYTASALQAIIHMDKKFILGRQINVIHWLDNGLRSLLYDHDHLMFAWTRPYGANIKASRFRSVSNNCESYRELTPAAISAAFACTYPSINVRAAVCGPSWAYIGLDKVPFTSLGHTTTIEINNSLFFLRQCSTFDNGQANDLSQYQSVLSQIKARAMSRAVSDSTRFTLINSRPAVHRDKVARPVTQRDKPSPPTAIPNKVTHRSRVFQRDNSRRPPRVMRDKVAPVVH